LALFLTKSNKFKIPFKFTNQTRARTVFGGVLSRLQRAQLARELQSEFYLERKQQHLPFGGIWRIDKKIKVLLLI
jgi:hypothetical protein